MKNKQDGKGRKRKVLPSQAGSASESRFDGAVAAFDGDVAAFDGDVAATDEITATSASAVATIQFYRP
ncbi:hypothetical protein [Novipirellula galeiformis]|uniref:hypothetical protein n=1 Tax=Novipirellula galeiformis TaxID=2528004 RepID=UPI0011B47FD0|nr:hypothetical protein [Novipirellula galeiformis]